jgi:MFS family permease
MENKNEINESLLKKAEDNSHNNHFIINDSIFSDNISLNKNIEIHDLFINNQKKLKNQKIYGICSLIGCFICGFIKGIGWIMIFLIIYLISYLKLYQKKIEMKSYYPFYCIFNIALGIFSPIGGFFVYYFGPNRTILISSFFIILGNYIMYISKNLIIDYFAFFIFATGIGISGNVSLKNAVEFFPGKYGLINGLDSTVIAIGESLFNYLAEYVFINPNHEEPVNDFYTGDIPYNFKNYLLFQILIFGFLTFLAVFLVYPYEHFNQKEDLNNIDKEENKNNLSKTNINEINSKKYDFKNLKKALKSKKFFIQFYIFFTSNLYVSILENSLRPIAINVKIKTSTQQITTNIIVALTLILTPIFGVISDIIRFKITMNCINILVIFSSFIFYLVLYNDYLFILWTTSNAFVNGAIYTFIYEHILKIFGIQYFVEISGVIGFGYCFASMLSSFLLYLNEIIFKNNLILGYIIIYGINGIFHIISFFLVLFENEEQFIY